MKLTRRSAISLLAATSLAAPFVRPARASGGKLNIYNWADYIGETTIADFQTATGIEVAYDNFSSVEEMEAKMLTGGSGYDVVLTANLSLKRLIEAGLMMPLDRGQLPSWNNLDPELLALLANWDGGNVYAFPYTWGTTGVAYNVDMVKERLPDADLESLDMILNPDLSAKLADCGMTLLDTADPVSRMVLSWLGIDPNNVTEETLDKVVEALTAVRPSIRTFDNSNMVSALPNKEVCVANAWSGTFATARGRAAEANTGVNLAYFVPKTGAPIWMDCFCIPADAPNAANAHLFLEYMLKPEVIAAATNYTYYANGNTASKPFLLPEIASDTTIFPTPEVMKRLYAPKALDQDQLRLLTRAWREVKNG